MLLDRHAVAMLMRALIYELSPDADDADQANNLLADPKRLDPHVDTILLLDLLLEASQILPDANLDQENNTVADPNRPKKSCLRAPTRQKQA